MELTNQEAIEILKANYPTPNYSELREAVHMVLVMLLEQEPQEPFYCEADGSWNCGNCGETVGYDAYNSFGPIRNKYCKECGRKVKWNA